MRKHHAKHLARLLTILLTLLAPLSALAAVADNVDTLAKLRAAAADPAVTQITITGNIDFTGERAVVFARDGDTPRKITILGAENPDPTSDGTYALSRGDDALASDIRLLVFGEDQDWTGDAPYDVEISNLTLSGGKGFTNSGGALFVQGELSVTGCTLEKNATLSFDGGAIYVNGNMDITDSTLTQNLAASGGAIYVTGNLEVTDTTLSENNATISGGALYVGGNLNITGSTLADNQLNGHQDDIYGAGAYIGGDATMRDTSFVGNTATNTNIYGTIEGVGAFVRGVATLTNEDENGNPIGGVVFDGNTGTANISVDGGGLYVEGNSTDPQATSHVTGATFTNNDATEGGGAFFEHDVTISGALFQNNTSAGHGGGLYAAGDATIHNTDFLTNTADNLSTHSPAYGGGAYIGGIVSLTSDGVDGDGNPVNGVTFDGNLSIYADLNMDFFGSGGGLYVNGAGASGQNPSRLTGATFTGNQAEGASSGGGAYINGDVRIDGATTFGGDTQQKGNSAADGAGLYANGNLTIENASFQNNQASGGGGGLYANGGLAITEDADGNGVTFANNSTGPFGGAIYIAAPTDPDATHTITGATFEHNKTKAYGASFGGGAIYTKADLTIDASAFDGNHGENGGAIHAGSATGIAVSITGSTLENNTADDNASGAIYAPGGAVTLDSATTFTNNTAAPGDQRGVVAAEIILPDPPAAPAAATTGYRAAGNGLHNAPSIWRATADAPILTADGAPTGQTLRKGQTISVWQIVDGLAQIHNSDVAVSISMLQIAN